LNTSSVGLEITALEIGRGEKVDGRFGSLQLEKKRA